MAINNITITNASSTPNRVITPLTSNPPLPNPPDSQVGNQDFIEVSSNAGTEAFTGYFVNSGLADDTVQFNGSPISSAVVLGSGNDLFALNTVLLGGAMDKSSVSGNEGNDVFQILNGNTVTNSILDGGFGSDLFRLQGSFTKVLITGGAGNDVARFENPGANGFSNFALSSVGLGAGDDLFEDGGFKLTTNSSVFNGGGGSDTINLSSSQGGSNADGTLITGGDAADFLYGTKAGDNTVLAGAGFDFIQVFEGDDSVVGGGGSDTILLGAGQDTAQGGEGNDVVWGFSGGLSGDATVDGGAGTDLIIGGTGDDSLFGGDTGERDYIAGWLGNDKIDGGSGDDLIFGDGVSSDGAAAFQVNGIQILGRNAITGASGIGISQDASLGNIASWLGFGAPIPGFTTWPFPPLLALQLAQKVNTAPDFAPWSGANQSIAGTIMADDAGGLVLSVLQELILATNLQVPGSDALVPPIGGNGNDTLTGNSGNDTIFGGAAGDRISGGLGADVIAGSQGADTLTGDDGNDIFVQGFLASNGPTSGTLGVNWTFNWAAGGPDVITDFKTTTNGGAVIDQVAFADNNGGATDFDLTNGDLNFVRNAVGSADFSAWNADDIVLFRGTWTSGTKQFVTSNSGNDALAFRAEGATGTFADLGTQVVVLQGAGGQAFDGGNFFGTFV